MTLTHRKFYPTLLQFYLVVILALRKFYLTFLLFYLVVKLTLRKFYLTPLQSKIIFFKTSTFF